MDPDALIVDMQRSRERLREILMAGQPGHEDADVFPRSRTMRLLFDPGRRGMVTAVAGALLSLFFRRRRSRRASKGLPGALLGLISRRR